MNSEEIKNSRAYYAFHNKALKCSACKKVNYCKGIAKKKLYGKKV